MADTRKLRRPSPAAKASDWVDYANSLGLNIAYGQYSKRDIAETIAQHQAGEHTYCGH